ncbi:hypothetical protein ENSA5_55470 [Enhygromyxa salina]|uniref:Endo-1,4-beta-xylanase A n=1 Tax=Enhygromyxa salina TaxID=215803 RepID=A0A2S9XF95_9BACT|nr:hypothetical protein [Enhygromyxa salina]PRP91430.1 hypothetical protein ENSA5_55470 [Enhygromyxa salina]
MQKLTSLFILSLSLPFALSGCGDDGSVEEAGESLTETGDGDGDPGDGDTGDGDGDPGDGDTGDGDTGDGDTGDGDTGDGDTGDGDSGYCAMGCEADADCCPMGSLDCPGDSYPDNWFCGDQGVCEFGGCASDDDCTLGGLLPGQECHPIADQPTCFEPCATDADCMLQPGATCSGEADDGTMYCAVEDAPGCESDADCGGYGICDVDSGACYCDQDSNCTAEGVDTCVSG